MKIISWNVNGLLARIQNGFWDFVDVYEPDILCIQETKADESQIPLQMDLMTRGYEMFWNGGEKRKNGVAILVQSRKYKVQRLEVRDDDFSGRVIALEFEEFIVVNVYVPMSGSGFINLEDRLEWDREFQKLVLDLQKNKPMIICGDLNVAHRSYLEGKKSNLKSMPGFSDSEWESHQKLLEAGFYDPIEETGMLDSYSHDTESHTHSWRLDYTLVDERLRNSVVNSFSSSNSYGSDHYPIGINLE